MSLSSTPVYPNGNGNGVLKKWQVYITLVSILFACLSVAGRSLAMVFNVGGETTLQKQEVERLKERVKSLEDESERKDVLEPQMTELKEQLRYIRDQQDAQTQTLQKLLMNTQRR